MFIFFRLINKESLAGTKTTKILACYLNQAGNSYNCVVFNI